MKIHTIDYKKHFGNDGTVYRQLIKIDQELMKKYNETLQKEYDRLKNQNTYSYEDLKIEAYTKKLEKGINYLHLTGLYYFRNTILENGIDTKDRFCLNRNTIIEVL